MTRIVIEEPCEHGQIDAHESESWVKFPHTMHICPGGSRRVLDRWQDHPDIVEIEYVDFVEDLDFYYVWVKHDDS